MNNIIAQKLYRHQGTPFKEEAGFFPLPAHTQARGMLLLLC